MRALPTSIPDVVLIEPKVFGDARGFFLESFNQRTFNRVTGTDYQFVQDNHSHSSRGVLRGLHYQIEQPQGKLVRVVQGRVWDVAVDIRKNSPTFGQWVGVELAGDNHHQLWIPPGFAHGFVVLSEYADFLYNGGMLAATFLAIFFVPLFFVLIGKITHRDRRPVTETTEEIKVQAETVPDQDDTESK
ncbi:dTDP-4-dehydrorhamnose 3,5-epimerase [Nitrosomonas sp.]|uniref:dTDP-4-dehydrorhamnose 3,5-epimerase n=1 Tax=Nitrosomonas sp. TaxID=42353 RepID=UPI0025DF8CF4|nr:dTDP-4-dehydrorhamnose 3,5-epimerase [Nitrosomonas sp.]